MTMETPPLLDRYRRRIADVDAQIDEVTQDLAAAELGPDLVDRATRPLREYRARLLTYLQGGDDVPDRPV